MIYTINAHRTDRNPHGRVHVPKAAVLEYLSLLGSSPKAGKHQLNGVGTLGISMADHGGKYMKANLFFIDGPRGPWSFEVKLDSTGKPNFVEADQKDVGTIICFPTLNEFDKLRIPQPGEKRSGKFRERQSVTNPDERRKNREAKVLALISTHWSPDRYKIEDHTEGIQIGSDYRIIELSTGKVVAYVDAKSSPVASRAQLRTARQLFKQGIPYWFVGEDWKMLWDSKLIKLEPIMFRMSIRQQVPSLIGSTSHSVQAKAA